PALLPLLLLIPARSTPFPYTTLFRSHASAGLRAGAAQDAARSGGAERPTAEGRQRQTREGRRAGRSHRRADREPPRAAVRGPDQDRKSTRLNSSHVKSSYAVFCLKKK